MSIKTNLSKIVAAAAVCVLCLGGQAPGLASAEVLESEAFAVEEQADLLYTKLTRKKSMLRKLRRTSWKKWVAWNGSLESQEHSDQLLKLVLDIAEKQQNKRAAKVLLEKLNEIEPLQPEGLLEIAHYAVSEGELEYAQARVEQALIDDSRNTEARLFLADLLSWQGHYSRALREVKKVQNEASSYPEIDYILAELYLEAYRPGKAEHALDRYREQGGDVEKIIKLENDIRTLRLPDLSLEFYYLDDSVETENYNWYEGVKWHFADLFNFAFRAGQGFFIESEDASISETQYTFDLGYTDDRDDLHFIYLLRNFEGETQSDFGFNYTTDRLLLDNIILIYEYRMVETIAAINEEIHENFYGFHVSQGLPFNFEARFTGEYSKFTDSNEGVYTEIGFYYLLSPFVDLSLGYEYVYKDLNLQHFKYWTPDGLRIHQFEIEAQKYFHKSGVYLKAGYTRGIAEADNSDEESSSTLEFAASMAMSKHAQLQSSATLYRAPSYDSNEFAVNFHLNF